MTNAETHTCEGCDCCVYVGDGDFICDRADEPEIVIADWQALREVCEEWREDA
jgi:hypothetical protein